MSAPPTAVSPPSVPSLARRLGFGALVFVGLLVAWVVVPVSLLGLLESHGGVSTISLSFITAVGVGLAALGAGRYILKPTRLFGPLAALSSIVAILYLLLLSGSAHLTFEVSSQTALTLDYGTILEYLVIVPVFGLASALVTTVEDVVRPGERLRVEYPPR